MKCESSRRRRMGRIEVVEKVDGELEQVAKVVAAVFGVRVERLRGLSRERAVAEPRHAAIVLSLGLPRARREVGAFYRGRSSCAVNHSRCRHRDLMETDAGYRAKVREAAGLLALCLHEKEKRT